MAKIVTGRRDGEQEAKALAALTGLVREQVQPPTSGDLEFGLRRVFSRLETDQGLQGLRRPGERERVRWWLAGAGALACLSVLAVGFFLRTPARPAVLPATLAYQVKGGSVVSGGFLRESGSDGVKLSFNEGTEFVLMPGTHGRLRSVGDAGARIAIEQGTAFFQVTPNTGRTWLVDVGPFLVTVKGTVFTVSWDPLRERFELRLRRGRVVVTGPVSGGDIVLRDGQRLVVNLPRAETLISEDEANVKVGMETEPPEETGAPRAAPARAARVEAASPRLGPPGPAQAVPGRGTPAAAPPAKAGRLEGTRRWSAALASGDWDTILADADRVGLKAILERASGEELFALADAARYRRRLELARNALLAERRRFPGSARAPDAAFFLGRVEEAGSQGGVRALRWYEDYLARAPSGTYASEALGRRMTLTTELEGAARARPLADEYLRRFPDGIYAGAARALQH